MSATDLTRQRPGASRHAVAPPSSRAVEVAFISQADDLAGPTEISRTPPELTPGMARALLRLLRHSALGSPGAADETIGESCSADLAS